MLEAALGEYKRRGRPVESTGWDAETIYAYMKQLTKLRKADILKAKLVGGWAWRLPKASESGEPAELPDLLDICKSFKLDVNESELHAIDGTPQKAPPFALQKHSKSGRGLLVDNGTGNKLMLPFPFEQYQLYKTDMGWAVWSGEPNEPELCATLFQHSESPDPPTRKRHKGPQDTPHRKAPPGVASDPKMLPGMKQTGRTCAQRWVCWQ